MRIIAKDIVKTYNGGRTPVLNGVSLDIDDGGLVVILGASGSGKSTLLSVLSGLERPDSGTVECGGTELTAMTDKQLTEFRRSKVGFVFQQYYLLSHLSVEKNIKLGAALAGKTDYASVAEAVGLKDKLDKRPSELSGGEQQRVCIARALRARSTKRRGGASSTGSQGSGRSAGLPPSWSRTMRTSPTWRTPLSASTAAR